MELTPREVTERRSRPRRPVTTGVIVLVVAAMGYVVWQGLNNATRYFYNADEALARRDDLGDKRFRLQGTVVDGSVARDGDVVRFAVTYDCADVDVRHVGDPPELFRPGTAVVLEGRFGPAGVYESDTMFVKHSNEYRSADEYDDRIAAAARGRCAAPET